MALLRNGTYNGTIQGVKKVSFNKKDGKGKFDMVEMKVLVNGNENGYKDMTARFGMDYAKKYFSDFCGLKSSQLTGLSCVCTIIKKSYEKDGETRYCNDIKYLNLIDENGKPIILRDEEEFEELW